MDVNTNKAPYQPTWGDNLLHSNFKSEIRDPFYEAFFQWKMTNISDKSADNQSEVRILVAYNKNCHLSLMTSFVKWGTYNTAQGEHIPDTIRKPFLTPTMLSPAILMMNTICSYRTTDEDESKIIRISYCFKS